MHPTAYPDINSLLTDLLAGIQTALGDELVGLYLHGSLVWGDFDDNASDIDLLAATTTAIDQEKFDRLDRVHTNVMQKYPYWEGRLEIAYLSTEALQTFKEHSSRIALTSPGEPFHFKEAGREYLLNWYGVQEKGVTLFGPPPTSVIAPISQAEYQAAIREAMARWRIYIVEDKPGRPAQAYAILTMCRALYAWREGQQASKKRAASWLAQQFPEWADLVQNALEWRADHRNNNVDHEATYPETVEFVEFVTGLILNDETRQG